MVEFETDTRMSSWAYRLVPRLVGVDGCELAYASKEVAGLQARHIGMLIVHLFSWKKNTESVYFISVPQKLQF